jgi:carbonic anhydrase
MESYRRLLLNNKAWVEDKLNLRADYFSRHSTSQSPEFLWIGCSDSRVPAEEITGVEPGDLFVHRNIANLVIHTDFNMLSVVQYAVEVLKVRHIIVCGHYGCGGVKTALSRQHLGLINKWLRNIKDVHRFHREEIDAIADPKEQADRLTELNVQEQVMNLAKTSIIQHAWVHEQRPHLHGWVYGLDDGLIKPIFEMPAGTHIDSIYEFDDL